MGKSASVLEPTVKVVGVQLTMRASEGCIMGCRSAFLKPTGVPSAAPMRKIGLFDGDCVGEILLSTESPAVMVTVVVATFSSVLYRTIV